MWHHSDASLARHSLFVDLYLCSSNTVSSWLTWVNIWGGINIIIQSRWRYPTPPPHRLSWFTPLKLDFYVRQFIVINLLNVSCDRKKGVTTFMTTKRHFLLIPLFSLLFNQLIGVLILPLAESPINWPIIRKRNFHKLTLGKEVIKFGDNLTIII